MTPGSGARIKCIKVKCILQSWHAWNKEFPAVRRPERRAEILILSLIKICPYHFTVRYCQLYIHNTDSHFRIFLTCLRISCLTERSSKRQICHLRTLRLRRSTFRIGKGRIYRKHRHIRIVKPVECQFPAVWRPPERSVSGWATEYFLIIYPGSISVQDYIRTVKSQTCLDSVRNIHDIQVIVTCEGQFCRVRRIGQIHCTIRLYRKVAIFLRSLYSNLPHFTAYINRKGRTVGICSVVCKHDFSITHPLPCFWNIIELLSCSKTSSKKDQKYRKLNLHMLIY